MKTENTLENKLKFFAQYFGQHVLRHKDWVNCVENNPTGEDWNHSGMLLQLKPLESISDEDAIKVAEMFRWIIYSDDSKISQVKTFLSQYLDYHSSKISSNENFALVDYLRSKGYALPFLNLSVQDLIDYGWIKLSEQ